MNIRLGAIAAMTLAPAFASAQPTIEQIKDLAGCYLVDYSYSESEVLDPNYTLDSRVYDVSGFTVKELIKVVDEDATSVRLQHFMQASDFTGATIFMMRHHADIWRQTPASRYKYIGRFDTSDRWEVEQLPEDGLTWVKDTTNLDDGLRYQCLGQWQSDQLHPRFDCSAFAPIPGRESRDMGRSDYNALDRQSSFVLYGNGYLERQSNIKTQFRTEGSNQLVREVGKVWQVRLPDSECEDVSTWANQRQAFWDLLADAWKLALAGDRPFYEVKTVDGSSRGAKIDALMERYYETVESNPEHADLVRDQLTAIIEAHRE